MKLDTGETTLNCELVGDGPAVVFTHGLGGSLESWRPAAERLRDRYRVLTWDVRGFGASDRNPVGLSPRLWAADLSALLRALEIERAVIAGISMGGVIAQRFALDHPQQTRALIAISTSSKVGEQARSGWLARAEQVEKLGLATVLAASGGPALSYGKRYRDAHAEEIAAAARLTAERNDPACYAAACRAVSDYDYTAELGAIRCPTLILQGLDDRLTPPGGSVIMSRSIPHARLEMFEECGHSIPTERFDEMMAVIESFVAGLPGGR